MDDDIATTLFSRVSKDIAGGREGEDYRARGHLIPVADQLGRCRATRWGQSWWRRDRCRS